MRYNRKVAVFSAETGPGRNGISCAGSRDKKLINPPGVAGILADVRNREFYEKPTTIRKRAKASAAKRRAKKQGKDGSRSSGMMAKSR